MRIGNIEPIFEQLGMIHVATAEWERQEHAIKLAAMKCLARGLAGFFAEVELQGRPLISEARQHGRQQEWGDGRNDPHSKLAVKRLAFGARQLGELLGLSKYQYGLVGNLLA